MWLMYPIGPEDIRTARRGVWVLLAASALWYGALTMILLIWGDVVMEKIHGKFVELPTMNPSKMPLMVMLAAFAATAALRMLGYRMCRVVGGALAVPESVSLGMAGAAIYMAACGTIIFGFTGLLALVAVFGSAMEMKFLRFPITLFGLCVSPDSVRKVNLYFMARTIWLSFVVPAALIMLLAHILIDFPTTEGGPYQHAVRTLNGFLHIIFKVLSLFALISLPILVGSYWLMLYTIQASMPLILDPNGPKVQAEPPPKPGFDQLKEVLQPPTW